MRRYRRGQKVQVNFGTYAAITKKESAIGFFMAIQKNVIGSLSLYIEPIMVRKLLKVCKFKNEMKLFRNRREFIVSVALCMFI